MLLRSSSTPLLNSWAASSNCSSPEAKCLISITPKCCSNANSPNPIRKMTRASSESDLKQMSSVSKWKPFESGMDSGWGLGLAEEEEEVDGGSCGGFTGGGDDGFGFGRWGSDYGNGDGSTDLYYQNMIEANPGNSLLLGNYARFLKEVRGNYAKAEEYCGRAILANPGDGNILSLYADLIWETQRNSSRAESYHDQAVKASPDDCYVLASYAKFLWDAEDEEEDEDEDTKGHGSSIPSMFTQGVHLPPPPLTAAS